jgi:chemotaxis protein methyltransferase CheR
MRLTEFDVYRDLLKERSGIIITQDKIYLLESRLAPVAKRWNFANLESMSAALRGVPDTKLVNEIVEAMTTNETSFFRDINPFDRFKDCVLPYLLKSRVNERKFKIWCAAASSGQEPYSLSMILKEYEMQFSRWNIDIIATDISNDILALAREAVYSQLEVQRGLPIQMLMKYFTQDGDKWRLADSIKKMVTYKYFNLLDSMVGFGDLDVIFCRNVLIYFDEKTKADILERMARQLKSDGFLFLGGAETVIGITDKFMPIPNIRGLYAKIGSVHLQKPSGTTQQALA